MHFALPWAQIAPQVFQESIKGKEVAALELLSGKNCLGEANLRPMILIVYSLWWLSVIKRCCWSALHSAGLSFSPGC